MQLSINFRSQLDGVSTWIGKQFESTVGQIVSWWGIEHDVNGRHGDITATSLTSSGKITANRTAGWPAGATDELLKIKTADPYGLRVLFESAGATGGLSHNYTVADQFATMIMTWTAASVIRFFMSWTAGAGFTFITSEDYFSFNKKIKERGRTAAMGEWTSFTPTWSNLTIGNGTNTGKYMQVGDWATVEVIVVWGSTTSIAGAVSMTNLPVSNVAGSVQLEGHCAFYDSSSGALAPGAIQPSAATTIIPEYFQSNAGPPVFDSMVALAATLPFTWATSDQMYLYFSYRTA